MGLSHYLFIQYMVRQLSLSLQQSCLLLGNPLPVSQMATLSP